MEKNKKPILIADSLPSESRRSPVPYEMYGGPRCSCGGFVYVAVPEDSALTVSLPWLRVCSCCWDASYTVREKLVGFDLDLFSRRAIQGVAAGETRAFTLPNGLRLLLERDHSSAQSLIDIDGMY
jgi:hypothetical protein